MKLTRSNLLGLVETPLSEAQLGDLFTMVGFELEELLLEGPVPVLDVNIMANRGDGASFLGLARELWAKDVNSKKTDLMLSLESLANSGAAVGAVHEVTSVTIKTDECTRYACMVFEDVENGPSPKWLTDCLENIGQRPISLLVDLTNYVMLETGQPLHAFDLDKLSGEKIVVRKASPGEKLKTLDGKEHELSSDQMMICDAERPIAAAGIMGGEATEVSSSSKRCLLESAHFDNVSVRRTRKQLSLQTEASYRFERWVDPAGVVRALHRFAELYLQATGKSPISGVVDVVAKPLVQLTVKLRPERVKRLMGFEVSALECENYLRRLGFSLQKIGTELQATVPTWRSDIAREEDLVEEIGRMHGYEKIPESLPFGITVPGGPKGFYLWTDQVREGAMREGFQQTLGHSLCGDSKLAAPGLTAIGPRAPASPEQGLLRSSLLISLAESARRNGNKDLHLFEIGKVFGQNVRIHERTSAGFWSEGDLHPPYLKNKSGDRADFYSLKGSIERLIRTNGFELSFTAASDSRFHPTRQAGLIVGGVAVGMLGQIHPEIAEQEKVSPASVLAEFDMGLIYGSQGSERIVSQVSRNPAIGRDLSILVDKAVLFGQIEALIKQIGGAELERLWLSDVYEGAGIPDGKHSLTVSFQLRKANGNFTDVEANQVRDSIVAELANLGATIR